MWSSRRCKNNNNINFTVSRRGLSAASCKQRRLITLRSCPWQEMIGTHLSVLVNLDRRSNRSCRSMLHLHPTFSRSRLCCMQVFWILHRSLLTKCAKMHRYCLDFSRLDTTLYSVFAIRRDVFPFFLANTRICLAQNSTSSR